MTETVSTQRGQLRAEVHEHARQSLFDYTQLIFPEVEPVGMFLEANHTKALAQAFERVARGERRRLWVAIPPGSASRCWDRWRSPPGCWVTILRLRSSVDPMATSWRGISRSRCCLHSKDSVWRGFLIQGIRRRGALSRRTLTDAQWERIEEHLPGRVGTPGRRGGGQPAVRGCDPVDGGERGALA